MIIGHGGNKAQLAQRLGCAVDEIIDMSSNLNPLGPPDRINQVISKNLSRITSLPEADALAMRNGFAQYHGLPVDRVVAGNGTTWFIFTLPKALASKKVLIVGPTYSDYQDACSMHNIAHDYFFLTPDNEFKVDIDALSLKTKTADTVFICNPNNPTGALVEKEKLVGLIKKHPDTIFVVDESYLPFVDNADQISFVSDMQYKNLIVLSSMSKIFTIPGLRTGFLSASPAICEKIMHFYQPWSVNALAQIVIVDIFDHPETIEPFYLKTREYIKNEKQLFLDSLKGLDTLSCFPSHTYFVLAYLTGQTDATTMCSKIGESRILIRDCSNFNGLSDKYIRFSLKTRPINMDLSSRIKEALKND